MSNYTTNDDPRRSNELENENLDGGAARAPRADGRIKRGEVRNPYGRAGRPDRRKRQEPPPQDIDAMFQRALREETMVTSGGVTSKIMMLELIIKKIVADLVTAPLKERLAALSSPRSFLRQQLERYSAPDEELEPWTDELEAEYQDLAKHYDFEAIAAESALRSEEYRDYVSWKKGQRDAGYGYKLDRMSLQECYAAYIADWERMIPASGGVQGRDESGSPGDPLDLRTDSLDNDQR